MVPLIWYAKILIELWKSRGYEWAFRKFAPMKTINFGNTKHKSHRKVWFIILKKPEKYNMEVFKKG